MFEFYPFKDPSPWRHWQVRPGFRHWHDWRRRGRRGGGRGSCCGWGPRNSDVGSGQAQQQNRLLGGGRPGFGFSIFGSVKMGQKRWQMDKLEWFWPMDWWYFAAYVASKFDQAIWQLFCQVDGQVLDVTSFLGEHPGGELAILTFAGKDATEEFNMCLGCLVKHGLKHAPKTWPIFWVVFLDHFGGWVVFRRHVLRSFSPKFSPSSHGAMVMRIHPPDVIGKYAPESVIGNVGSGVAAAAPAAKAGGAPARTENMWIGHFAPFWMKVSEGWSHFFFKIWCGQTNFFLRFFSQKSGGVSPLGPTARKDKGGALSNHHAWGHLDGDAHPNWRTDIDDNPGRAGCGLRCQIKHLVVGLNRKRNTEILKWIAVVCRFETVLQKQT